MLAPSDVQRPVSVVLDPPVRAEGGHALRGREAGRRQAGDAERVVLHRDRAVAFDGVAHPPHLLVVAAPDVALLDKAAEPPAVDGSVSPLDGLPKPPAREEILAVSTHLLPEHPAESARVALDGDDVVGSGRRQPREVLLAREARVQGGALYDGSTELAHRASSLRLCASQP